MGIGAAVSVIGGISSMSASRKQAKAAGQSSALAQEWLEKAWGELEEGEGSLQESLDLSYEFKDLMDQISQEYGDYASNMWQDWENTFGSVRNNLVDYYQNLDPMKYSTQWKADIEQNMGKALDQFDQVAAQSGIYTSGMKQQMQKEAAFDKAKQFAQADLAAPDYVAQQQNQFYGAYGEPYRQQAQGVLGQSILNQANMANMGYGQVNNAFVCLPVHHLYCI